MKTKDMPSTRRTAQGTTDLARGLRFLLHLRESLDQSRARGIPLAEAKRQLAKRLAAEGLDAKGRRAATPRPKGRLRRPRASS